MLIYIPIVDIIEEAREAMVIILMVVIGIQDVKTTRMDATRNGTSMRDIVKKMKYKEKNARKWNIYKGSSKENEA